MKLKNISKHKYHVMKGEKPLDEPKSLKPGESMEITKENSEILEKLYKNYPDHFALTEEDDQKKLKFPKAGAPAEDAADAEPAAAEAAPKGKASKK